ncbi:methylamine utilization protein MauJ [Pseudovibrio sp. Ad26]|uniref:methylamine utilization protein MauJ n=1 Tax=Pseudovibrio sp. Ad26 TaxID=989410 RepID=UPI0007AE96EA|nr:methylamine utilization protein MauJ [Pseudovibrio sp. Ad26]KZL05554.1 hypothetical protein PsAD26_04351 [Pseudovibrio sp. Ad26]
MYARELMIWLHERLAERGTFAETQRRFESLRGYNLLPRGRENAGVRLSNKQIANAVLGFVHPLIGYSGHASLILGKLRPVGGEAASFNNVTNLNEAIASLIEDHGNEDNLTRMTLSVEQDFQGEEYSATLYFRRSGIAKTASYVSRYAESVLVPGAEELYDHERLERFTAIQRSFAPCFFGTLSKSASISRHLNRPLKTDWQEYKTEEERDEFHRRLGASPSSKFLNLRVDAQVSWPKEPTRVKFGGHHLVLFPKTKENSHSVSVDLIKERLSSDDARSLINRMLSIMSWCEDQPSSLHEGWSGNPVPVPVPKQNLAFMTMHQWHFYRELPHDEDLLMCLSFYRDGLNARSVGLASHAVLSFFRVFETRYDNKKKVVSWVDRIFDDAVSSAGQGELDSFEADRKAANVSRGQYVYKNCRVATAHAAKDAPSDPDGAEETRRLLVASRVIQRIAKFFIVSEFKFSTSYLSDNTD